MGIRTIFRQPSCKPLSTCDPSLFQNKNTLESVHGGQNPVRPYLWVETSRLPPIYTALVVDKHWIFTFTRLPNLLYSKRQLYQRMKLGKTVTFDYAVKLPTVTVRQMVMVASWTPQQQQYNQKDEAVQPPQIVIKLRKARIILYTGLRKF
jgi:hypothetical protein